MIQLVQILIEYVTFLKKWDNSDLFLFIFVLFQTQILQKKTVCFSKIRTRIVGIEGEHADHLTTTTAQKLNTLLAFN